MKSKILNVKTHRYPDGALEFQIFTQGPVRLCAIDYGDGSKPEVLKLPPGTVSPHFYAEHKFSRKNCRVVIAIQEGNFVHDRRSIFCGDNNLA